MLVRKYRRREWSLELPGGSLNLHGLMWQLVRACMCRDSHEQSNVIGRVLIPAKVDRDSFEQTETI